MISLPFTPAQFLAVFVRYNEAVWPMQLVLNAAALACVAMLLRREPWAGRMASLVLALLWAWMAVAYHFAFFAVINPAAWLFGALFLLGSAVFAWHGVAKAKVRLRSVPGPRAIAGAAMMVYALVLYPAIGHALGHRYPAAPTFGLPCPTTIFTLGLLLFSVQPVVRSLFVVPLLWAAIGSVAAFQLGIPEDFGLLAAGVGTLALLLWSIAPAAGPPQLGALRRPGR